MGEEVDDELSVFEFSEFKKQLLLALKRTDGACSGFIKKVAKSDNLIELVAVFKDHGKGIAEWAGIDMTRCDNYSRVEIDNADLEHKLWELQGKFEPFMDIQGSVADEYKVRSFAENASNYNLEEIEYLMRHGKELLKSAKTSV